MRTVRRARRARGRRSRKEWRADHPWHTFPAMRSFARRTRFCTSAAVMAALVFVCGEVLPAQARPVPAADTLNAKARDSLIAAILADTTDTVDVGSPFGAGRAVRQSITIRPTLRRYSVGAVNASEEGAYSNWTVRLPRAAIRLDLTPVSYTTDTSLVSGRPRVGVNGMSPVSARLDLRLRSADTLRVYGQSTSFPGALSSTQTQALGSIGTSTIDLDAAGLGVAARIGTRYTLTQPIGEDGVTLSVRGGIEYDPKPSGREAISWRGTTLRAGVGVNRSLDDAMLGASVEVTRSISDSLGGRNLFPGGGSLTLEGRALRFVGADGTGFVSANAFYSRPINIERPDQPTRLIPIGDFMALTVSGALPVRTVTVIPSVSLLRESSKASAVVTGQTTGLTASGYTATASLGVSVALGRFVTVTPEVGGAFGNVSQTVSSSFPRRIGRPIVRSQTYTDPIRGGWVALELNVSR